MSAHNIVIPDSPEAGTAMSTRRLSDRKRALRRRDALRYSRAFGFSKQIAIKVIELGIVDSGVRGTVARQFIRFRLGGVTGRGAARGEPPNVGSPHAPLADGLPITHADGSTENWIVNVLPFRAVTVPLDERLAGKTAGVGDQPRAYNPASTPMIEISFGRKKSRE